MSLNADIHLLLQAGRVSPVLQRAVIRVDQWARDVVELAGSMAFLLADHECAKTDDDASFCNVCDDLGEWLRLREDWELED